jgi:hypothetical protein
MGYSAKGATLGGRSLKSGQSRWFIGYKKHTLRLWLRQISDRVVLVPLMSWAVPAHRGEALFIEPSVRYCAQTLNFVPDIIVGDMAYIALAAQRRMREQFKVAIVTKLRPDMRLPEPFEDGPVMTCDEGQRLEWLGLQEREQLHWFGVTDDQSLCRLCWQQSSCPKEFSFAPREHEILYGAIPLSSRVAERLLRQCRTWIEGTQSYEKNQLGLTQFFLNSLELTWTVCLLADTVCLLRAAALSRQPPRENLLGELAGEQLKFELKLEDR